MLCWSLTPSTYVFPWHLSTLSITSHGVKVPRELSRVCQAPRLLTMLLHGGWGQFIPCENSLVPSHKNPSWSSLLTSNPVPCLFPHGRRLVYCISHLRRAALTNLDSRTQYFSIYFHREPWNDAYMVGQANNPK